MVRGWKDWVRGIAIWGIGPNDELTRIRTDERGYLQVLQVPHHHTHEDGGSDEINVQGLSGVLADLQRGKFSFVGNWVDFPAPGEPDRLAFAVDRLTVYRDTGTEWQKVATAHWDYLEGAPSDFFPAPHAATHEEGGADAIDPNNIGANWNKLVNKPSVFPPTSHATSHQDGGADPLDHGTLPGLGDDDHPQYLLADGSRPLSDDWDIGDGRKILADQIRARDAAGLKLTDAAGKGIFVADGGYIGVGTLDPDAHFVVSTPDESTKILIRTSAASSKRYPGFYVDCYGAGHPVTGFSIAGGTKESPSGISGAETVGIFVFRAYDGATWAEIARFGGYTEGTFGYNNWDGKLAFYVGRGTKHAYELSPKMEIASDGKTTLRGDLDLTGHAILNANLEGGAPPAPHAATHENGGADEINVNGLSGQLADYQKTTWSLVYNKPSSFNPSAHGSRHEVGGSDEVKPGKYSASILWSTAQTTPASYQTLDTGVGSRAVVFLRIRNTTSIDHKIFLYPGDAGLLPSDLDTGWNLGATPIHLAHDTNMVFYTWVLTDANGYIKWKCSGTVTGIEIMRLAYIKLA